MEAFLARLAQSVPLADARLTQAKARPFERLRERMSPAAQARARRKAERMLQALRHGVTDRPTPPGHSRGIAPVESRGQRCRAGAEAAGA